MIELDDAKTLVSAYKFIERTCEAIDEFVFKHAINYGPDPETTTTFDVINNIINLIERKNRLINLKNIVDLAVAEMPDDERKVMILKMRYRANVKTIQSVLNIPSERTTFRRVTEAINSFLKHLRKSINAEKIKNIMQSENWIVKIKQSMQSSVSI